MRELYLAEKPDIGRALAGYLWPEGDYHKEKGFLQKGDTTVSWAFGHILGLAAPEAYGEEYKQWANYPVLPKTWILKPASAAREQLMTIKKLLAETDVVIHAGDPDREGQLLIDEILQYLKFKGQVKRILINAKDDASLKRSFDQIVDNKKFRNLYEAGLGREQADWLVGMNLSRAYTVNARRYGYEETFRIGRVKVPTLALVVKREKEIQGFKPQKYYELQGKFQKDGVLFSATLHPGDKLPLDAEGRIKDQTVLQAIKLKVEHGKVTVKTAASKNLRQNPPLPHSLDTLQVEANKWYGYSPKEVLDTVQALYENKYVSYPRSDCNYIPLSQKDDAVRILPVLQKLGLAGAEGADLSLVSKAFNDAKITAHHALIPTGVMPKTLDEKERRIYTLIAQKYIVQFYPACEFQKTSFSLQVADEIFTGNGKMIQKLGFKAIEKDEKEEKTEESNLRLPALAVGDELVKGEYSLANKLTTAPKRFTEGSLLAAMANIWRYVDADNPNREKLKEVKGIGTPATRDTIIAELQMESIKGKPVTPCLKKVKKELIPTNFGISLIEHVDESLTLPDTTAEMEYALSEIAAGKKQLSVYMDEMITMIQDNIRFAEEHEFPLPKGYGREICPICGEGELVRHYSAKVKKYFYLCSSPDCVSPESGKKIFYEDDHGKPLIVKCPDCKTVLVRLPGKNGPFWLCNACKKTFNDVAGHPDFKKK